MPCSSAGNLAAEKYTELRRVDDVGPRVRAKTHRGMFLQNCMSTRNSKAGPSCPKFNWTTELANHWRRLPSEGSAPISVARNVQPYTLVLQRQLVAIQGMVRDTATFQKHLLTTVSLAKLTLEERRNENIRQDESNIP